MVRVRKDETEGRRTGRDTLDTTATSETTDGRLCNALNVVTENLSVTFGTAFAKAFATFTACNYISLVAIGETIKGWSVAAAREPA